MSVEAETPAAPAPATEPSDFLTDLITSVPLPDAEPPAEPEAPPEPETEEEADPFAPAALRTPEGIKAAQAKIEALAKVAKERQRLLDKGDIKQKTREKNWERKRDEEVAKLADDRAVARALRAQLGLLRTGTATQILEVIGNLTGKPGRKVWEELTHAALRDGKAPLESPVIDELKAEIAELKAHLAGQHKNAEQEETDRARAFANRRKAEIVNLASDAAQYPELAGYAKQGKQREILSYVMDLKRASVLDEDGEPIPGATPLDDAECLSRIESEIRTIKGTPAPPPAGAVQGAANPPGDKQSRSTPQSLSPSNTRTRPSTREMTEEERLEELRRNPDFVFGLFG